jgi:hypothetical protein
MLGVQWNPQPFSHFLPLVLALNAKARNLVWTLLAAQSWVLWITRNKFTIEAVFFQNSQPIVYSKLVYLCSTGAHFSEVRRSKAWTCF